MLIVFYLLFTRFVFKYTYDIQSLIKNSIIKYYSREKIKNTHNIIIDNETNIDY
jgi:hypothetical protein